MFFLVNVICISCFLELTNSFPMTIFLQQAVLFSWFVFSKTLNEIANILSTQLHLFCHSSFH